MRIGRPVQALLVLVGAFAVVIAVVAAWLWWESGERDRRLARVAEQVSIDGYRLAKKVEDVEHGREFVTAYYVGPATEDTIDLVSGIAVEPSGGSRTTDGMDIGVATGHPEYCLVSVSKHDRTQSARPADSGVTDDEWARERSGELDVVGILMFCDTDSEKAR
ncbi:hypothetical protein AB0A74_13400 [Saccharothrix sp. NPDC042600]|uniref:hypothetical protein n=1 Tax=Saccharothrix TaxID=2071 RepID=UPI0033CA5559|nr:hypothetical protein GCM10017745_38250 [Saccharothrix mutabilis subsp. capreolus]